GFVIAAPDGARDDIAAELARRTGFALVVASSLSASGQKALVFYAEIHASSRHESADRIEITTAGVDESLAARLRTLYELIRGATLMENAGRGAAEAIVAWLTTATRVARGRRVVVVCGKGGNGGDGFVAARWLARGGLRCDVVLVGAPGEVRGDAAAKLQALK